jgi:hypothetical protein
MSTYCYLLKLAFIDMILLIIEVFCLWISICFSHAVNLFVSFLLLLVLTEIAYVWESNNICFFFYLRWRSDFKSESFLRWTSNELLRLKMRYIYKRVNLLVSVKWVNVVSLPLLHFLHFIKTLNIYIYI